MRHDRLGEGFMAALIALAVFAVFAPALVNGFVVWDDDFNLTNNPRYRGLSPAHLRWMFTTVHGGHYQPLSWVTLGLDHALWGMNPMGYHLTSVLLHAANAVLFYFLLRAVLPEKMTAGPTRLAAVLGALAFGIHPLRVESVAWVSERRDVLAGLFWLLTLLAYLRAQRTRDRRATWLGVSLCCFGLSLLSKAWGITLPVVLLLLDAWPLHRFADRAPGSRARVMLEKVPFALLALAGVLAAFEAQRRIPAMRTLSQEGPLARAAQASWALCFYVGKTILPVRLAPLYLLELHVDPFRPRYLAAMLVVATVTVGVVMMRRRWPWACVVWLTYAVIASPVLGVAQTGPQSAADRYTYLACLPWAALVAAAFGRAFAAGATVLPIRLTSAVVVLVVLATLTVRQERVWRDSRALWEQAVRIDPTNWVAWTNRGWARHLEGDDDGAMADYEAALRISPDYFMALNNRGYTKQIRGDLAGAAADYEAALAVYPTYADAWYNRGTVRQAIGDLKGAIDDYSETIRLSPQDPRPWNNRGWVRQRLGDLPGAVADYSEALAVAPPGGSERPIMERNLATARAQSAVR